MARQIPLFIIEEYHEVFIVWNYFIQQVWIPAIGNCFLNLKKGIKHLILGFGLLVLCQNAFSQDASKYVEDNSRGVVMLLPKGLNRYGVDASKDTLDLWAGRNLIQEYKGNIFLNGKHVGYADKGDTIFLHESTSSKKSAIVIKKSSYPIKSIFPQSEWRLICHDYKVIDTLYSLRENGEMLEPDIYAFYSEYEFGIKKMGGVKLNTSSDNSYTIQLKYPIKLPPNQIGFYFNFYSNSISEYEIEFVSISNQFVSKERIPVYNDGYQYPYTNTYPFESRFVTFNNTESQLYWQGNDSIEFNLIKINITPKDKVGELVIGDFNIIQIENTKIDIRHPYLSTKFFDKSTIHAIEILPHNSPSLFPIVKHTNSIRGDWVLEQVADSLTVSEKMILGDLFEMSVDRYPFYEERNLFKNDLSIFTESAVKDTAGDIYAFARNLNSIADRYHDGHFNLRIPNAGLDVNNDVKRTSPVRFHKIYGNYYLSAIFQENAHSELIGMKLKAIDNMSIDKFLHSIVFGSAKTREEQLFAQYLNKVQQDSTIIELTSVDQGDTIITIYHNKPVIVPDNFQSKHRDFRVIDGNVAYYQIKHFFPGDFIDFISHIKHVQSSKGIVLDLRANGGGNSMIAMSIFSLFISSPSIFCHSFDFYNNKKTSLVRPHPEIHIDKPVVVLVDQGTACAAEAFADAMRFAGKAVIMGKDKRTAGTYADLIEINFPSGVVLNTNVFSERYLTASGKQIENLGIEPDIFIDISKVKDLYPYEDKCLRNACQYIMAIY